MANTPKKSKTKTEIRKEQELITPLLPILDSIRARYKSQPDGFGLIVVDTLADLEVVEAHIKKDDELKKMTDKNYMIITKLDMYKIQDYMYDWGIISDREFMTKRNLMVSRLKK